MAFEQLNLLPEIGEFLKENSLKQPTEVQSKSIPPLLKGEDVSVLAQTGSGKTLAYTMPLFHRLKMNDDDIPMESQFGAPRGIILTPTRELNHQVFKVSKSVAHHAKLRVRTLVGGDKGKRSRRLNEEAFDILISSPGRLLSSLERKEISAELLEMIIFDEADQLLDMGFSRELKKINELIAKQKIDFQVALFSATWPAQYQNFLADIFPSRQFKEVVCQGGVQLKRNIETYNIHCGAREKKNLLNAFLKEQGKGTGVVFVNRKEDVLKILEEVKKEFPRRKVNALHGGLSQGERKKAFEEFRNKGGILLASDIAARGLDIDSLGWVLNYDLPFEAVYYIHRCGRTGRAGKLGRVYNFVTAGDSKLMGRINEAILSQSSLALKPLDGPKGQSQKAPQKKTNKKKVTKKVAKKAARSKKAQSARRSATARVSKKTPRYKKKKKK